MRRVLTIAAVGVLSLLVPRLAVAEDCAASRELRWAGDAAAAEPVARACLERAPGDPDAALELAAVLAALERYPEGLEVVESVLAAHPEHTLAAVLKARLLAWSGDPDAADAILAGLPPAAFEDPETARFRADVALWREDWAAAAEAYARLLPSTLADPVVARNRAIARWRAGDPTGGRAELVRLCTEGGDRLACGALHEHTRAAWRLEATVDLAYEAVHETKDGLRLGAAFSGRPLPRLTLGTSIAAISRGFGDATTGTRWTDVRWAAFLGMSLAPGFVLEAEAGLNPTATFSPRWTVAVEPGWEFPFGLQIRVRLRRLTFVDAVATVVSPDVRVYVGPLFLDLRYSLSLDAERGPGHGFVGRASFTLPRGLTANVVGGGGDRADSLDSRLPEADAFGLVGGGVGWDVPAGPRIAVEYVFRLESDEVVSRRSHRIGLSCRVRF